MFSFKFRIAAAFALALVCAHAAAAQQADKEKPAEPQNTHVTHTNFKNRVFDVKYRDPATMHLAIKLLTSGHKGSEVSFSRTLKTLTVRDFPENLATIEESLKRLDTPEAARPAIELRMHVLIASNAAGGANQYPADLRDAVGQLHTNLNFKSYHLLTSIIQRARDRAEYSPSIIQGEGVAQLTLPGDSAPRDFFYSFQANSLMLHTSTAGVTTVQLGDFTFRINGKEGDKAAVRSDVSLRDGEKVIVGTAGLRDKALILVMTAKLIN